MPLSEVSLIELRWQLPGVAEGSATLCAKKRQGRVVPNFARYLFTRVLNNRRFVG